MRLQNFELISPYSGTEIRGLGHTWDLHSFAVFAGLQFLPERNEVKMEWHVPAEADNPWGSPANDARGCSLHFTAVLSLQISSRNKDCPSGESPVLSAISKAVPKGAADRFKDAWDPEEEFNLIFEFQDERKVEIAAEAVRLEQIS